MGNQFRFSVIKHEFILLSRVFIKYFGVAFLSNHLGSNFKITNQLIIDIIL
jgi:hypothetical protein